MSATPANSDFSRPALQTCYPDQALFRRVSIVGTERLAAQIVKMTFQFAELASSCRPGQFFMVRLADTNDPLIGRPFALFDSCADTGTVQMVFTVAGNLTRRLAQLAPGATIDVWGPLGNGFSMAPARQLVILAGGIGYTPFLAVIREYLGVKAYGADSLAARADSVTMFFGARTADELVSLDELRQAGADLMLATDDGSQGFRGFITDLARSWFDTAARQANPPDHGTVPLRVLTCGPVPMMKLAADIAAGHRIPCEVSLETPMACGIGICFSCAVPVKTTDGWDYRRCCVDGPVFDGYQMAW